MVERDATFETIYRIFPGDTGSEYEIQRAIIAHYAKQNITLRPGWCRKGLTQAVKDGLLDLETTVAALIMLVGTVKNGRR